MTKPDNPDADKRAPKTLRMAFYLFVATGVLWLFGALMDWLNRDFIADRLVELRRDRGEDVDAQQIHDLVGQAIGTSAVLGVVLGAFLALFGYKATQGLRRARTLVTIIASITALYNLFFNSSLIMGLAITLAALAGVALLYAPSSRAYFPRYIP